MSDFVNRTAQLSAEPIVVSGIDTSRAPEGTLSVSVPGADPSSPLSSTSVYTASTFIAGVVVAMMVMPMTILRDRFDGDRMARTQSLVAMTFMVVPMVAPMIGQTVLLFVGWRWIFLLMLPLGSIALAVTSVGLRLPFAVCKRPIDWAGAALLIGTATALLMVPIWGGRTFAWGSPQLLGVAVLGVLLGAGQGWRRVRGKLVLLEFWTFC